tara:strand:+ start:18902 stop:20248 length:1347 start_codon:yes stop_codon:yes gene_type:complete
MLQASETSIPNPALVESVEPGSIGEELGIQPGDKILSINGTKPRDLIDYKFLISDEELNLEILDQKGSIHKVELEKDADTSLGISFTEALFDGLKQCNNHCPFCFIDQQPTGKRKSLYFKDDDYRLSFLYGSYLTLTNLSDKDWHRIKTQHLSPLFISVHATDPNLRTELLKNPKAGLLMNQINWFSKNNLQIHAQVVICPGLNDGEYLRKTLFDLFDHAQGKYPTVISTAVVPVGLTRFRPKNDGLEPVNRDCANKVIAQVEELQEFFKSKTGSRFAWLADEWYLIAEKPLPVRTDYEDLPQQENGVGSIRAFLQDLDIATQKLPKKIKLSHNCSWVVGKIVSSALIPTCKKLNEIENLTLNLYGLPSPYWGQDQVVTGLLTGQDLIDGLIDQKLGSKLLIPSVMLKQDQPVFLDDMTISEVSDHLQIPIKVVYSAQEVVDTALGMN